MRVLVHLVVAVLICGGSALKDQPEGEIQQDEPSNQQLVPPEGHDDLESGFLSVRGYRYRWYACKEPWAGYDVLCYGECSQSWHGLDNYDWCRTYFVNANGYETISWEYCTCWDGLWFWKKKKKKKKKKCGNSIGQNDLIMCCWWLGLVNLQKNPAKISVSIEAI